MKINKNDNIYKNEVQEIQTNIDKYRETTNITEYHIISKLIFLGIIIPKFMRKRLLLHVKNVGTM